ncbi:MAG TPA: response regulator [Tepidisphaeraceae bacterium]
MITPASILITDDERNIRMMLRTALEADGYAVAEAANGREALAAIERIRPDLMVLDLNMPVLDGMALLESMKGIAAAAKPRVIILTAYGSIPAAVKATRLGAIDFLEKPITPNDLRETIRSALLEPELDSPRGIAEPADGYDQVLDRIRKALRLADFPNAEAILMKVAEGRQQHSAEYFNLLGVLYEAQGKWRLARKCYGKAMRADKRYQPAQVNMRRIYELQTFGRSEHAVSLGDEVADISRARAAR